MISTLEELMYMAGCEKYPKRWQEIFREAMSTYERQGCCLLQPEYYDRLHEMYGCFENYREVYKEAAVQAAKDEVLGRVLTLLVKALEDDENRRQDLSQFSELKPPKGKDALGYHMITGLALCSQFEKAAIRMREIGLSKDWIKRVLRQAVNGVSSYERLHGGEKGYHLLHWAQGYMEGKLFPIERLVIEPFNKFAGKAVVFKNSEGKLIELAEGVTLHRAGIPLGFPRFEDETDAFEARVIENEKEWIGYAYNEKGLVEKKECVLKKAEWKRVLANGDPVISIHIPGQGKLTVEMVDKSLEEAKKFMQLYFPEYSYKAFVCYSWMMDPQLEDLLGEDTNIVKFMRRFRKVSLPMDEGRSVFNFVFNKPDMNFKLEELSEHTALERKLKKHYLSGKVIYRMAGYFL